MEMGSAVPGKVLGGTACALAAWCEDGDEMSSAKLPMLGNKSSEDKSYRSSLLCSSVLKGVWQPGGRPCSGLQLVSLLGRLNITHQECVLPCSRHLQSRENFCRILISKGYMERELPSWEGPHHSRALEQYEYWSPPSTRSPVGPNRSCLWSSVPWHLLTAGVQCRSRTWLCRYPSSWQHFPSWSPVRATVPLPFSYK